MTELIYAAGAGFLSPPDLNVELPFFIAHLPGAKVTLAEALKLTFFRGVFDGFLLGILVTVLFLLRRRSS